MNRRAVLIAVGKAQGEKEIPGAYRDLNVTSQFLDAIGGGAWDAAEKQLLTDANREQVLGSIRWASQADYSVVLFAGHGCEQYIEVTPGHRVPMTHMVCADGLMVSRTEITPRTPRRLVLLDCCRGLPPKEPLEEAAKSVLKLAREAYRPRLPREQARKLYEAAILRGEEGSIYVNGCKLNGSASDKYSFTSVLVATAKVWAEGSCGIGTTDKLFDAAKEAHARLEPDQCPELDGGRRRGWFPLAVGEFQ